jgi:hypothetical protein
MAKRIHETRKIIDEHAQEGFIMVFKPYSPHPILYLNVLHHKKCFKMNGIHNKIMII